MDRFGTHAALSERLSRLDDGEFAALLATADRTSSEVGGSSCRLDLDGTAVFAKSIPLTDLERRTEHVESTANLFGIPLGCHYGLGGPGFSAWRELASNRIATAWVLSGECANFPLLHHWRVMPTSAAAVPVDAGFWKDSPPVRARAAAMSDATAELVLVSEFFPHNLLQWLTSRFALGADAADAAVALVETHLPPTIAFMNERGLTHFDPHFENVVTDGDRLYVGDFGLALSSDFDLAADEREFLGRHRRYDVGRASVGFAHAISAAYFRDVPWREGLERFLETSQPVLPARVERALRREGRLAVAFLEFSRRLKAQGLLTRYSADL